MDFNLTEEQLMVQRMAKELTEHEIEPLATQMDREGKTPKELRDKMAQVGLFGMEVAEEYGGTEAGTVASILALEQIGHSGTGAFWLVGLNNSIPEVFNYYGTEEQKRKYIRPLIDGSMQSSILFTEPDTGSDPSMLVTTAIPDGDSYVINGTKRFITFGGWDGYGPLWAKDETGGCSCFIIQKNVEGYSAPKQWELMGGGGMEAMDLYFENMRVPKENLLGEKGDGFKVLLHWIAGEKIQSCAVAVGNAQAALDEAIKYCKERIVRDRPISAMQGHRWLLAEMYSRIEAARWMTYRNAFLQEQDSPDWLTEAAASKVFVVPTMTNVIMQALGLHGGYGYTKEFKIERLYRAIIGNRVVAVSDEINRSIVGASLVR